MVRAFRLNEMAFTGLEAAIVLVAFVVVAAIFSYMLIGAGFRTSEKAQETIHKSVEQTSTNVMCKGSIYGIASSSSDSIDEVRFTLGLVTATSSTDLTKMQIVYSNETVPPQIMTYTSGTPTAGTQFSASRPAITGDEQVDIMFTLANPAPKNTKLNIEIRPSGSGSTTTFSVAIPTVLARVNVLH